MTPFPPVDLTGLLWAVVNAVLTFGGGTLVLGLAGWLVDALAARIPFLKPYRDLIVQWVAAQVEAIRRQRAAAVVKEAGQMAKANLLAAKDRAAYAADKLHQLGIATNPEHAAALVEQTVGDLKGQGINP
ncbi:MAG TPA: hypothetical protein VHN99_05930 [Deinococcales bacterium]|nr:hypothetical protein [Deinococcales bacterium]